MRQWRGAGDGACRKPFGLAMVRSSSPSTSFHGVPNVRFRRDIFSQKSQIKTSLLSAQ